MIDADCACGCGQRTPIAKQTDRRLGHVKGQPVRFVNRGHAGRRPPAECLWEKVDKQPGDGCWVWTGGKNNEGYGQIRVAGRLVLAHRLAWGLTHGQIPPETPFVLHDCPGGDNPLCVRHLWLGTHADNMADMIAKGRQAYGERSGQAKLTEPQVQEIRRLHGEGNATKAAIGRRFGVNETTIRRILAGHRWAHLVAPGAEVV